jgi:hypothetical protein
MKYHPLGGWMFIIKNPSHVVLCLLFYKNSRCARTVRLKARLRRFALLLTFSVSALAHGIFLVNVSGSAMLHPISLLIFCG